MTPKASDPRIRSALIDAAARLLAGGGPGALTTRALAAEVGTSTMAVYTYFKGMEELRAEVRKEGFDRLARWLAEVVPSDDPVADVAALGAAYTANALENPHLYRFMFVEPLLDQDPGVGVDTFERLVDDVARAVSAGRFRGDPRSLATQLWVTAHGTVTLHLAGLLTLDQVVESSTEMALNLFEAFGDDPERARRSMESVALAAAPARRF